MPGGDRTGPAGMGPMTGRAAGLCAGYPMPGYMSPIPGGGRGFGRRGGWGRRNWYYATGLTGWQRATYGYPYAGAVPPGTPNAEPYYPPGGAGLTREDELAKLKGQAEYFEDVLSGIQRRIAALEKETEVK